MEKVVCYVGGRAKDNKGAAAVGVYITDAAGVFINEVGQSIGNATDTFATYYSVMLCLQTLQSIYGSQSKTMVFELCLDNEMVKQQLNNELPINDPGSVPMFIEIHNMRVVSFPNIIFSYIQPTDNQEVTRLVAEVLDGKN